MANYKSAGDFIREWRSRLGLRQADLAAELGVRLNTVSRWELGTAGVPPFLSLALAELERKLLGKQNAKRSS
jgi:transcriptional regulator with XRE-family HTH domain